MTDEPMAGGKRRIDQVLAPELLEGLSEADMDELRRRRDLCRAEREYLSYIRRLLQGRRDILRDELDRRRGGGQPGDVVERVTAVLAEAPRGTSRGEAMVFSVPEEEMAAARRRVERLLADSHLSDTTALSESEIEEGIGRVDEEERQISDLRGRVMSAHDTIQGELKRRFADQLRDVQA